MDPPKLVHAVLNGIDGGLSCASGDGGEVDVQGAVSACSPVREGPSRSAIQFHLAHLRHSSLELNWHLPVRDREALDLKVELVRTLDQQDISTYGLSFTIKTSEDITPFSTVVIEKNNLHNTYNILYSKDFNPNLMDYQLYARDVEKESIAALLIELSHIYYDNLPEDNVCHNMGDTLVQNLKKDLYQF